MLPLNKFISGTLKELIDGVLEAQRYADSKGAQINPNIPLNFYALPAGIAKDEATDKDYYQIIEFDISITTMTGDQASVGAGIFVGGITIGAKGKTESKDSSISRMKFTLPVSFPKQTVPLTQHASQLPEISAEKSKWKDMDEAE